ncbi:hypothetical protein DXG03_003527 [Asterophora parasitica]|uniref:Ribonuclease H n=1 Tax=Asterophora parasitica TaxID=117018 RepID=A0A9P7KBT7_9AGAR|nr:hypothetical protein DXG03_003527 [Asterophora parasitica]
MPRSKGPKFYAVQDGRETGVFLTWDECESQVKGYPGAKFKSFSNAADAEAYVSGSGVASTSNIAHTNAFSSDTKSKKRAMPNDVEDESRWDVVYCDGACKGNGTAGSIAGIGVWWEDNDPRRTGFREWLPKWAANNYKTSSGGEVKNLGVIKYLSALLGVRAMIGQKVVLQHVKGHSGDRGNDGADYQANLGACLPPLAERNWITLEKEVRERTDATRSPEILNILDGTFPQGTEAPRKVRKVSHEVPFSTSSAPAPSPLVRLSRKFSPSPSTNSPINESTDVHPALPSRKPPSAPGSRRFHSPSRRHGAGFFVTSPPPSPGGKRGLKDLPSASQRAKALDLVPNGGTTSRSEAVTAQPPFPAKPVAMSVNKEDVNLDVSIFVVLQSSCVLRILL